MYLRLSAFSFAAALRLVKVRVTPLASGSSVPPVNERLSVPK